MRDPARIHRILRKLGKLWSLIPDQRFNQMIVNLGLRDEDLFNLEDEIFERRLDEALSPGGSWR